MWCVGGDEVVCRHSLRRAGGVPCTGELGVLSVAVRCAVPRGSEGESVLASSLSHHQSLECAGWLAGWLARHARDAVSHAYPSGMLHCVHYLIALSN